MMKTCKNLSAVECEEVRTGLANQCQFVDVFGWIQQYRERDEKRKIHKAKENFAVVNVERCNAIISPPVETAEISIVPSVPVIPLVLEPPEIRPLVVAQMKPRKRKAKPSMRGSFPLRRPNIPQTLTVGLGGSGAIRKTSTIKCLSIEEVLCKASGKGGESKVTPIVFTLKELYPLPESDDKFSEFKISKVDIALLGFELPPEEYPNTTFIIAPNPDERAAASVSELLRHYGVRVVPILACQNSVVKLISVSPRFDETGSQNHYVSGFLQVGEAQGVEWYGAVIACKGPEDSKTLSWKVKLLLTVTLTFRGRQ